MFVSYLETTSQQGLTEFFPEDYKFVRKEITVRNRKCDDAMIYGISLRTVGLII